MSAYTDSEFAAMDAAAERRVADDEFARRKPELATLWPFSLPLTPMQQARIEAQRRAIFGDER